MSLEPAANDINGRTVVAGASPSDGASDSPAKKRQKRNKPTLSCEECVERKTKCDRGRPICLACIKRQSSCRYSDIANLIASADPSIRTKSRRIKVEPSPRDSGSASIVSSPSGGTTNKIPPLKTHFRSGSVSSTGSSPFLLSNVPHSKQTPSNIFGVGSSHPFANYWTYQGGLPEVIGVFPSKDQADILVAKYFDAVDPVYPMINKRTFCTDYDSFWALPTQEKYKADPAMVALQLVVYAMATQFLDVGGEAERAQNAEFYVSAAHQTLRISSYLSRPTMRSIQAMVLMGYFLMNANKASDAWAFLGVLIRQAYAIGLNREPDTIEPNSSAAQKNQRRKVWQAVYFQDTFLTVLLKLPPTSIFADVKWENLSEDPDPSRNNQPSPYSNVPSPAANPMSISSIAPTLDAPWTPPTSARSDIEYIRSMWQLANLVSHRFCQPRCLSNHLTESCAEKTALLIEFEKLYASLPTTLTDYRTDSVAQLAATNPRVARQNLFLRSNYWHCMMIINADENVPCGVYCDAHGALQAGRLAIASFFDLWDYLRVDAGVWWVFQHRAFEEALTMCNILYAVQQQQSHQLASPTPSVKTDPQAPALSDPLFMAARADVKRMLDIIESVGSGAPELQKTRTGVLRSAFEGIA